MADPGHKRAQRLIEAEAFRRIITGEVPATLDEFAGQLADWFNAAYPAAMPLTRGTIENQVRDTWHKRHDIIEGGGL